MDLSRTLTRRLISTVDGLRDLLTRFGLRPYEVRMVRTKWTGGYRGAGQEIVVFDEAILPTPLILGLDGLPAHSGFRPLRRGLSDRPRC